MAAKPKQAPTPEVDVRDGDYWQDGRSLVFVVGVLHGDEGTQYVVEVSTQGVGERDLTVDPSWFDGMKLVRRGE